MMTRKTNFNTTQDLETRLKRLRFRAWHRGTREGDLIVGQFVDLHKAELSHDDCAWFEELLEEPEQDLIAWITGKQELPEKYDTAIMAKIMKLDFLTIKGDGA